MQNYSSFLNEKMVGEKRNPQRIVNKSKNFYCKYAFKATDVEASPVFVLLLP